MTLPQEIQQAIANRATDYADQQHVHDGDDQHIGYLDGATEWAGNANDHLVSALEAITGQNGMPVPTKLDMVLIAQNALAKYKEVGNG